jgi:hypothetical protein
LEISSVLAISIRPTRRPPAARDPRVPRCELILQGRKRIEYRTQNVTKMLGKRFWINASKGKGQGFVF